MRKFLSYLKSLFARPAQSVKQHSNPEHVALTPFERQRLCKTLDDHNVEWHFQQALVIALVLHSGGEVRLTLDELRRVAPDLYRLAILKDDDHYIFTATERHGNYKPFGYDASREYDV